MLWTGEEKITTYLETKSFKTVSKYEINNRICNLLMIYYWDKKFKKRLHALEADIITIRKKHWFDVSSSKDVFFTGCVPNDRCCACYSNKS